MMETDESRAPDLSAVISIQSGLSTWLLDYAYLSGMSTGSTAGQAVISRPSPFADRRLNLRYPATCAAAGSWPGKFMYSMWVSGSAGDRTHPARSIMVATTSFRVCMQAMACFIPRSMHRLSSHARLSVFTNRLFIYLRWRVLMPPSENVPHV